MPKLQHDGANPNNTFCHMLCAKEFYSIFISIIDYDVSVHIYLRYPLISLIEND